MERTPIRPNTILFGDCIEVLRTFPDDTFTAVVTDPPYGLSSQPDMREVLNHWLVGDDYRHRGGGFMGRKWDSFVPGPKMWEEIFRVLKPGGHVLSFSGTRTYDLMVTAMRLASLEVRDKIDFYCEIEPAGYNSWCYGSGFPKSLNIGKAIDKALGVKGTIIGKREVPDIRGGSYGSDYSERSPNVVDVTEPATEEAKKWEGYGTALKPAHEPIADFSKGGEPLQPDVPFIYTPKVATKERNKGCKNLFWLTDEKGQQQRINKAEYEKLKAENEAHKKDKSWKKHQLSEGNVWPTVKPIELVRYLVRLVKMPGENLILDPFMGSGTTPIGCVLEGCNYIGIDKDPVAFEISRARIHYFECLGEKGLE